MGEYQAARFQRSSRQEAATRWGQLGDVAVDGEDAALALSRPNNHGVAYGLGFWHTTKAVT